MVALLALCGCGGITRAQLDPLGDGAGSGGASSGSTGNAGSSSGQAGASSGPALDPDGICTPPCGVTLQETLPGEPPAFAAGTDVATLFYDTAAQTFELRTGTTTPKMSELVLLEFTREPSGFSEWTSGNWPTWDVTPNTWLVVGYSRPEDVDFTSTMADSSGRSFEVVYRYSMHTVLVESAKRTN
ncbi:MAG TPA: hypothetical protein VGI10_20580 [Polyangiaceae bacterium]